MEFYMTLMIVLDEEHVVFMDIGRSPKKTNSYEEDYNNFCDNFISTNF